MTPASRNLPIEPVQVHALLLPPHLVGAYDVAMLYAPCEAPGGSRRQVVAAH